jgi:hypothetical protein
MENLSQHSIRKNGYRRWTKRILIFGVVLFLVLSLGLWIAGAMAKSNLRKQYPAPGQLVDIGGYRLHINKMGQGSPTIILEAGLDDFSVFWSRIQSEVSKTSRV